MTDSRTIRGWQLHHHEQLNLRASSGAPMIRVKFYHYPPYRQTVHIDQPPTGCKLKTKGNNTFYVFQHKVHTKEIISFDRIMTILPTVSSLSLTENWGSISDIPLLLQRKYKQSFTYWPTTSDTIHIIAQERWFATDDLAAWVLAASRYVATTIKYPENQEKRLGADSAIRTGIGDCDEYTDLFITLARLRGIPCRRLTGYHITTEPLDVEPHAWGELFSPLRGWTPIDLAMHNIGSHTISYVIQKIEEFNPSLLDYHVQTQSAGLHYRWEQPLPDVTPLF